MTDEWTIVNRKERRPCFGQRADDWLFLLGGKETKDGASVWIPHHRPLQVLIVYEISCSFFQHVFLLVGRFET